MMMMIRIKYGTGRIPFNLLQVAAPLCAQSHATCDCESIVLSSAMLVSLQRALYRRFMTDRSLIFAGKSDKVTRKMRTWREKWLWCRSSSLINENSQASGVWRRSRGSTGAARCKPQAGDTRRYGWRRTADLYVTQYTQFNIYRSFKPFAER
jgi:hypothetical protein